MRDLHARQPSEGCAGNGGSEEGVSEGVTLARVLPFADDEDGVFVEEREASGGDVVVAGVMFSVGVDVAEGGGVVAGAGGEVAAEAEHVGPVGETEFSQVGLDAELYAGGDEAAGVVAQVVHANDQGPASTYLTSFNRIWTIAQPHDK
jgi:cystathionine beta-lyase family protein involved in aluminum resistance